MLTVPLAILTIAVATFIAVLVWGSKIRTRLRAIERIVELSTIGTVLNAEVRRLVEDAVADMDLYEKTAQAGFIPDDRVRRSRALVKDWTLVLCMRGNFNAHLRMLTALLGLLGVAQAVAVFIGGSADVTTFHRITYGTVSSALGVLCFYFGNHLRRNHDELGEYEDRYF